MNKFLEKIAANRLGKEALKAWKAGGNKVLQGKLVNSLVERPLRGKNPVPRVKFLARGGDVATGKVTMPKNTGGGSGTFNAMSNPRKRSEEYLRESKIISEKKVTAKAPESRPTPQPKEPAKSKNKYLGRVGAMAGIAGVAGLAGYGIYKELKKDDGDHEFRR